MPMRGVPISKISAYALQAEEAGAESLWAYEIQRNPFIQLCLSATTTTRMSLGTAVAQAFPHTPFSIASVAADIDEISQGRAILGIGPGAPELVSGLHSIDTQHPIGRMREFIDVIHASWDYHNSTDGDVSYNGKYYQLSCPPINPFRQRALVRPRIPIYLGATGKQMLQLAGEKADGVIGAFWSPSFIEEQIRPQIARGAERADRDPSTIDIASLTICSVSRNHAEAVRRARIHVGVYTASTFADPVIKFHGLEREQEALRIALLQFGFEALEDATDDKLLETFSVAGTTDEVKDQLKPYSDALPHNVLHTPYAPQLTGEDIGDAFSSLLDVFGDLARAELDHKPVATP
ncbi:LLM class flavin-dependent oxidoreductase [Nocardia sp. CA-128927]|uniref:LLM class flavin-dependent oxidoreductase n=1 Tax=Nocardia sp. CA-128927 TaxID=3239975 RepID=UPI003D95B9BC